MISKLIRKLDISVIIGNGGGHIVECAISGYRQRDARNMVLQRPSKDKINKLTYTMILKSPVYLGSKNHSSK